MSIKCEIAGCNYPDCLCAPCLDVQILVPSRANTIKDATMKMHFRGGTPRQAMAHVRAAIRALQAELEAGEAHHGAAESPEKEERR